MDNCPFCGAERLTDKPNVYYFKRHTVSALDKLFYHRGTPCYEAEITALKALVREMGEVLSQVETWNYLPIPSINIISAVFASAQILNRPKVRAILEEGSHDILLESIKME